MKYNVGDLVKVIDEQCGHRFQIGEVVRVIQCNGYGYRCENLDGTDHWSLHDDELVGLEAAH